MQVGCHPICCDIRTTYEHFLKLTVGFVFSLNLALIFVCFLVILFLCCLLCCVRFFVSSVLSQEIGWKELSPK